MPDTALLRVDASGVVVVANDVAERLFGPCNGRRCCDLVAAMAPGARLHCTQGCAGALLQRGGTSSLERTTIADASTSLSCSSMGGEVVVAIRSTGERKPESPLSPRERQVLALVARGHTNRRISRQLDISMSTVRTHVERILDKLGARSRAAAVTQAIATGQLTSG